MRRRFLFLSFLALLLQACEARPPGSIQFTPVIETTRPPKTPIDSKIATPATPSPTQAVKFPAATSTSTLAPTTIPSTPTPTQEACMLAGGSVDVYEFTTTLLPDPLVYRVYLPPCYGEHLGEYYPVLYLIHGQTYSDTQWDRLGVPETADRLIRNGESVPFIVVMPRDRVWLEPTEDNFGKAVVQALVPWIDEHYRTLPDREHRAIGGLSRGAAWAIHIGLSNGDLFSRIGVHSGFVFYSDNQEIYMWLHNTPPGWIPHIYMDVGDDDRPEIAAGSAWLEDFLTRFNIPHEWHMFEGEHDEAYWQAHVENYLRWYTQEWGN